MHFCTCLKPTVSTLRSPSTELAQMNGWMKGCTNVYFTFPYFTELVLPAAVKSALGQHNRLGSCWAGSEWTSVSCDSQSDFEPEDAEAGLPSQECAL